ncbi:conserved exported hypothetical protein [Bradyrhizobium oligotrophicum S58]|uniref:Uncharacterized protein n=1 Tax=Bradyrhizobium oligotrophicum S58 TaxID=1245469 RepID=M4ZCT7_9BRAD|nr:hypothetical protein [Bradyrhizobium oligotrophicum]BAM91597.1 conserved exported hypothetical protein [Bradyrhizobium oligotrophicum S58]
MRALSFGALALVSALGLAGCSRPVVPQVAVPCVDLSGRPCADNPSAAQPTPPASSEQAVKESRKAAAVARRAALQRKHAREARRRAAAQRAAMKPTEKPIEKPVAKPSEMPPVQTSRPDPAPSPAAPPALAGKIPSTSTDTPPNPAKVQREVMVAAVTVAAELAERMTALRVPQAPADTHLVAVVLARPAVRAISDLSGKVIAIDERYAKSNSKITAAMSAAGASEVLLLEGQATAITRLTNGEVVAAVVALASPEAAEAFPKIEGFRLFSVMLPKP